MERLINKGLNFSVLPKKLDITQLLVEYKKFERWAIWTEFWFGREVQDKETKLFKTEKTNRPKNYTTPEDLKVFLNSVRSDFMDPRNRNSIPNNLPNDELEALKHLQKLQRDRKIIIKPCDN